jgi:hypothetical protein
VEYNGDVVSGSNSPDVMGGSDSPGDACFLAVVANPLSWITLQQSSRFGDPRRKRCMLSSDVWLRWEGEVEGRGLEVMRS